MRIRLLFLLLAAFPFAAHAQKTPDAVDLGLSVKWGSEDTAPEQDIPVGWRLPTLEEIKELREGCAQSVEDKGAEGEWIVFTAKSGNAVSFLWPIGSRSARSFIIVGSDGCYLREIILNPLLNAPNRDGYYTWEALGDTRHSQRRYPVRLVRE